MLCCFSEDGGEGVGVMSSVSKSLEEKGSNVLVVFDVGVLKPIILKLAKDEAFEYTRLMGRVRGKVDIEVHGLLEGFGGDMTICDGNSQVQKVYLRSEGF